MDDMGFSLNSSWVGNPPLPVDTSSFPTSSTPQPATSYSTSLSSFAGLDLLFDLKPLFVPLYSLVILVACSGNLFLLLLIGLNRKRHNTTHFLIGNLALVDLVMCVVCVPLTASYAFDRRGWLFGRFMCHFVALMQSTAVFAAVLSLAAIALDRYVVVAYPVRRRAGCQFCWGLVAFIWLFSLALSAPTAVHTGYLDLSATGLHMVVCEEFWHGQELGRIVYSSFVLSFSYFVPLTAVTVSHLAISYRLSRRKVSSLMATGPASNHASWGRKRRKTFCLLVVSVLCFALSWLPLQVVNLIRDLDTDFTILDKSHVNVIQVSCHLFAMSSACYNPFIYASLHHKFLAFVCRRFLFPRYGEVGGRGPGGSLSTSHRLTRLNNSSSRGETLVARRNKMTHESWMIRPTSKSLNYYNKPEALDVID